MKKKNKKKFKKIITIVFLSILFIINTLLVITGKCSNIDNFIYNFIIKNKCAKLTNLMKIITFFGGVVFIIILTIFVFILYLIKHKKIVANSILLTIVISTLLNNIIKIFVRRSRPDVIMISESSFSYPSGHAMASVTMYGLIIYLLIKSDLKNWQKIIYSLFLLFLIIGICISRIYLGAHYFTDIFGGVLLSLILLILFSIIDDNKNIIE